ncbi:A/G-specific adenine glycosylase [Halalkalibacillus sediminis]|uniref:Adenine DNA glycosylase n=1 Tax=Halalkalibacillus sediminis TaxID=2018042 RepID=A0A2I0QS84_9BACI|nr:A/G-specific adenine glycosylase [Halalkalibacillus sediminis]PKR76960.1 A/G-specific adenine glycosylase [Halalkalibacillus sediminis]
MEKKSSYSIPVLFDSQAFQRDLIEWYQQIKRELPWRENQDPYRVWVSEIMLQQTRVDTVIPYFNQFMARYPTVQDLSEAAEQDVLKSWEGLGYYSRARNLHTAVKEVVANYDGKIPSEKKELKKLKGVGPYTQGAILSIAFDQPEPAVDGNVMRVMSRVLHIDADIAKAKTKSLFEDVVSEVISTEDPSSFNQGLMELGALICNPTNPKCEECPVQKHCMAYELGIQTELPVKTKNKKQKKANYTAIVVKNEADEFFIQQRASQGLLAGMWEFPLADLSEVSEDGMLRWFEKEYGIEIDAIRHGEKVKHIFSHLIWEVDVMFCMVKDQADLNRMQKGKFVSREELADYPLPNVQLKILKQIDAQV